MGVLRGSSAALPPESLSARINFAQAINQGRSSARRAKLLSERKISHLPRLRLGKDKIPAKILAMKQSLITIIHDALNQLHQQGKLPATEISEIVIERTRDPLHGDFACNIALRLAKTANVPPRQLAEWISSALVNHAVIDKVEIAGPGFINFFINQQSNASVIADILQQGEQFGHRRPALTEKLHLEYVSSNPTGPLHVGHGRGAAYGSSLANLLKTQGYTIHQEYYVNDAGRQMHILAASIWLRYLALHGETFTFPHNGYQGDYVIDIAKRLQQEVGTQLLHSAATVFANVRADAITDEQGKVLSGDKEAHIDDVIRNAKQLLGKDYHCVFQIGLTLILADIKMDLTEFRVYHDEWFSEQSLMDNGAIQHAIDTLQAAGHLYEQDGAVWFKATAFGDEKDRVVRRANGETTYFASDIAYHLNKLERGYDRIIDVLGADHHGYVPRVRAIMQALTDKADALVVPIVQFVSLYRHQEKVQMSTRSGSFVTLRELRDEVGNDAARFFFVMRKLEQHMDFDLELAKSQSNDNPVYYVQYAHARICSVMRQLIEKQLSWDPAQGLQHIHLLTDAPEQALIKVLQQYPELLSIAAQQYAPYLLANYLRELATEFHAYYNQQQFIVDDANLRNARLCLINACRQVVYNGLDLLGVTAPESM